MAWTMFIIQKPNKFLKSTSKVTRRSETNKLNLRLRHKNPLTTSRQNDCSSNFSNVVKPFDALDFKFGNPRTKTDLKTPVYNFYKDRKVALKTFAVFYRYRKNYGHKKYSENCRLYFPTYPRLHHAIRFSQSYLIL